MSSKINVQPYSGDLNHNSMPDKSHHNNGGPIEEQPTLMKVIEEIMVESASDSTMHGIPNFFKRKHWLNRLFWIVCFLASAAVCSWMISETMIGYFNYETVTKTQRVHLVSTEFPAVSICSLNAYMTNESYEFVKSVLIANRFLNPMAPEFNFRFMFDSMLKTLRFVVGMNAFMPNLTDRFRKSFGHSLDDMLLSCTYNMNDCTANDFEWYYDLIFGNCYKFNGGLRN